MHITQQDFQKDIVRTAEGLVSIGSKHVEVGMYFLSSMLCGFLINTKWRIKILSFHCFCNVPLMWIRRKNILPSRIYDVLCYLCIG
jgi:hypothetical protein